MSQNSIQLAAQNYYVDGNESGKSPKWRKGLIFMAIVAIGLLYVIYQNEQEKKRRAKKWF